MLFSFGNFAYFFYISKLCKESVRVCTILPGCLTNMKCRTILHARSTFLLQTHETIFSMCQIFGPAHVRMCDRYTFNLSISGMLLNWSIFEIVKSNCFFFVLDTVRFNTHICKSFDAHALMVSFASLLILFSRSPHTT